MGPVGMDGANGVRAASDRAAGRPRGVLKVWGRYIRGKSFIEHNAVDATLGARYGCSVDCSGGEAAQLYS
jgi:hypothetical protein